MAFKNIMVPYDDSVQAGRAFKKAIEIAKKHDSTINVVTCIERPIADTWYVDFRVNKEIMRNTKKAVNKYLSKLEDIAKQANIHVIFYVLETNSIIKQLLSFEKSKKIDLIVLGNSGKGKFDDFLFGSVSSGISQRAKCPVLIVK